MNIFPSTEGVPRLVGCGISKSCSATGFAVALGAGALGGAISGGVGSAMVGSMASYTATSIAYGDGPTVGGYAGVIAGGSSSLLIGDGALAAAGGDFAGGVTGAAMSSGNSDPSKMLISGIMGAGLSLTAYSAMWVYNDADGFLINEDAGEYLGSVPENPEGSFVADKWVKEAEKLLIAERNTVLQNGEDPLDYEAGASFRVRTRFWSGKQYLSNHGINVQYGPNVSFSSYSRDGFRMHLHPGEGRYLSNDLIHRTNPFHPSRADYANQSLYQNYGINSYLSATRNNSTTEIYSYKNGKYYVSY